MTLGAQIRACRGFKISVERRERSAHLFGHGEHVRFDQATAEAAKEWFEGAGHCRRCDRDLGRPVRRGLAGIAPGNRRLKTRFPGARPGGRKVDPVVHNSA